MCQGVIKLSSQIGSQEYLELDNRLWEEIQALDEEAKTSLSFCKNYNAVVKPGRFVRFPVKSGYARYIVSRVGKKDCKLVYLPYVDGFQSDKVVDGKIYTGELEGILGWEDRVSELFKIQAVRLKPIAVDR